MAAPEDMLAILRRRSGSLAAAPCQCAAILVGAHWRSVALAGRFGRALGCAAQLEDDLLDQAEDALNGRQTVPRILAHHYPTEPEVVETTTLVLIQRFLHEAAQALEQLPACHAGARTGTLWTLLPATARAA
jgi:geranylgeranyl pyrophosphate synthase